jgi:uncharacterized membrane protein
MKFELTTKNIVTVGIVAAIYAVLTVFLAPLSYGPIQFRISEALNLLAFVNPVFAPGIVLGCFIANLFSPLGMMDVIFGTTATLFSVMMIVRSKKLWVASLWPVIFNGVIIGAELQYAFQVPFLVGAFQVALGEFVVVTLLGVPLFSALLKNTAFAKYAQE